MTTITESFTAADGSLSVADLTWTTLFNGPLVKTNAMSALGSGAAITPTGFSTADLEVSAVVRSWAGAADFQNNLTLIARASSAAYASNSFYFLMVGLDGTWTLQKHAYNATAGVYGNQGLNYASTAINVIPQPGDTVTLGVQGTFVYGLLNGALIVESVDAEITSGTHAGLAVANLQDYNLLVESFSATTDVTAFTFTPPATSSVPPTLPVNSSEQTPSQYALMRFFRARPEGINVYCYKVGTLSYTAHGQVTEDDPIALYDSAGVVTTNGWEDLDSVFWGGTNAVTVTDAQAAALTVAGYTLEVA